MKKKVPPMFIKKDKWRINQEFLWYMYSTHGYPPEIAVETIKNMLRENEKSRSIKRP